MRRAFLIIIVFVVSLSIINSANAAPDIAGRWKVYTTLVSGYDPTNPNYHPGDKRLEKWVIRAKKKTATLRTPAGTIQGTKVGKAWVFEGLYNSGLGIITGVHLVARVSGGRLRGTNEVTYYSAQFGYPLAIDALSFRGSRI